MATTNSALSPTEVRKALPIIWSHSLSLLRNNSVMAGLVNRQLDEAARGKGEVFNVRERGNAELRDVQPGPNSEYASGSATVRKVSQPTLGTRPVRLRHWIESTFALDANTVRAMMNGTESDQVEASVDKIATGIDAAILGLYKYNNNADSYTELTFGNTDGTLQDDQLDTIDDTPGVSYVNQWEKMKAVGREIDASSAAATTVGLGIVDVGDVFDGSSGGSAGSGTQHINQAAGILGSNKVSNMHRSVVLDPISAANAMNLRALQDMSWANSPLVQDMGEVPNKFGFRWSQDQQMPIHTVPAAAYALTKADFAISTATSIPSSGTVSSVAIKANLAAQLQSGDLIWFSNEETRPYCVKSASGTSVTLDRPLEKATTTSTTVKLLGTHRVNLCFQKDAIYLVTADPASSLVSTTDKTRISMVDPVSNLNMTICFSQENYRDVWSVATLFGVKLMRPEHIMRMVGEPSSFASLS